MKREHSQIMLFLGSTEGPFAPHFCSTGVCNNPLRLFPNPYPRSATGTYFTSL